MNEKTGKLDLSISFYDIDVKDALELREFIHNRIPVTVDISISSEEKTQGED